MLLVLHISIRYLLRVECGLGIVFGFRSGKYDSIVPDFKILLLFYLHILSGRYSTSMARSTSSED